MKNIKIIFTALVITFSITNIYSQSAKKYWKNAQTFVENKKYNEALTELTNAISIDSTFKKAYIDRAFVYEKTGDLINAANDYDKLVRFDNKDGDILYNAGRINYLLSKFDKSYTYLEKSTSLNKKNLSAYQYKIKSLIKLKDFEKAISESETALDLDDENAENHYYHGLISDSLNKHQRAEWDYNKAISLNKKFEEAYVALAKVKSKLDKKREAVEVCNQVIAINNKNIDAYYTRAIIFHDLLEYPSAINDLSKIILLQPERTDVYLTRGIYYKEFNQPQNAINDFTKILSFDDKNIDAYINRAKTYEEILNYQAAIKDYEKLTILLKNNDEAKKQLAEAQNKLYILNKENNKPEIEIINPIPKNSLVIGIPDSTNYLSITGKVTDESNIKYIKINDLDIDYSINEDYFEFNSIIDIAGKDRFTISAVDVYDNVQTRIYVVEKTEVNKPQIAIIAPYASDNNEIYLDNTNPSIYVEGKVNDDSYIKSIIIDGTSASFAINEPNPTFSANVNILNKNIIKVIAIDEYGNETISVYNLNRDGAILSKDNAMGKTWVVFIENSNYRSFASLEGPTKDILLMKSALANYKIHNIIHKKDMGKQQMEKFFTIELRDLVRSNKVNSLLIWYAGHGKVINETGYWIPIDATREDEFSYFNINTLKGSMHAYSKYITHTLIITDACESGPTFYQAMRAGLDEERSCDDWKDTRFKSSQVFSSAGYELAVDNSQFTKTFANALINNPNACMPIEEIVKQVQIAVKNNNQQEPKFGKIAGLEDENGTFFFITK